MRCRLSPRVRPVLPRILSLKRSRLFCVPDAPGFEPVNRGTRTLLPVPASPTWVLAGQTQPVPPPPIAGSAPARHPPPRGSCTSHKIIRVPDHTGNTARHQFIERMQIDVGQQRTDHGALRRARRRVSIAPTPANVLIQERAHQGQHTAIADCAPPPGASAAHAGWCRSSSQVGIDHERVALLDQLIHFAQSILQPRPGRKP